MTLTTSLHPNEIVTAGSVRIGNRLPLMVVAGPCQIESRAHALEMAAALKEIATRLGIGLVFKSSFDKANRTSLLGRRGTGLDAALPIIAEIRETIGLPVVTDVHEIERSFSSLGVLDKLSKALLNRVGQVSSSSNTFQCVLHQSVGQFV